MRASASIRPYLLAALLDSEEALAGRPALVVAADDVGARDLARALGAYLAPRRVRYYPSRGTGYESHLAPPPHLVGLRIGALDALTRRARGRATSRRSSSRARWRLPRRCPTPRCAPRGSSCTAARRSTSATSPSSWSRPATSAPTRSRSAASSRSAATSSTSFPPPRSAPRGWSCSATRSSRSAGSRPSRSARSARRSGSSSIRPPSWRSSTASWPRSRARTESAPTSPSCCRWTSFRAPLELIGDETAVLLAAAEEIPAALRDHWEDVTTAMHDADARHLYVDVAEPLAERAVVSVRGVAEPNDEARRRSVPCAGARPRPPAASPRPNRSSRRSCARLPGGRHVRGPRRGRAGALQPQPGRRSLPRGGAPEEPALLFAEAPSATASSRPTCASP